MKLKTMILILILLCPSASTAAYKIYLKNGSVISGVSSYEKQADGEIIVNLGGGSIGISEKEVLRIEETKGPEMDLRSKETTPGKREETPPPATKTIENNREIKANTLKTEIEDINSEIQAVEEQEARLTETINAKVGERTRYTTYQLRQLESEIAPLRQELFEVQQKKSDLLQRKARIEDKLKGLE